MKSPLFFTTATVPSASADRYAPIGPAGSNIAALSAASAGSVTTATLMPLAGTLSSLRVRFPTALTQGSYAITLLKGTSVATMADTALTATIGTASLEATDTVNTVAVAAGEYVAWRITPTGTPTAQASPIHVNCVCESTTAGKVPILSFIAAGTTAGFCGFGIGAAANATEATSMTVMPSSGTLSKMAVHLSSAPGAGNSRTITLRRGTAIGALTNTTLTVTISGTDTTSTIDLGATPLSLAVGDFLAIEQSLVGTPAASQAKIGFEFTPTVSGEVPCFGNFAGASSTSLVRYNNASGQSSSGEAVEAETQQPAPVALTLKRIRYDVSHAPGAGKSRTLVMRSNGAATALSAAVSEALLTQTATADVSIASGDRINFETTPAGTPAATTWSGMSSVMVVASGSTDITGSGAVTLDALTANGAGAVDVAGASAITLDALTSASGGTVDVTAVSAVTLDALTAGSGGTVDVAGSGSVTLADITSASGGTVDVAGASAITLDALTTTSGGTLDVSGSGAVTLEALTAASSGAVDVVGSASFTLDSLTSTSTGAATADINGDAAITLAAITSTGAGVVDVAGSASVTLAALTTVGSGGVDVSGSSAFTLDALTSVSAGVVDVAGASSITLDALTSTATGSVVVTSSGVLDLSLFPSEIFS